MNKLLIIGRISSDIEVKSTTNKDGKASSWCSFSVAVPRQGYRRKDANGNNVTDFFSCMVSGPNADFLGKYFSKGQAIEIEGSVEFNTKENNGVKTTYTNVIVSNIGFPMPVPKKGEEVTPTGNTASAPPAQTTQAEPVPKGFADEDIPF